MKGKTFNENLNKIDVYINKECYLCHRRYPDTILNIEGYIHHHENFRCFDTKACKRHSRKHNK
jgi:hypothetical protein